MKNLIEILKNNKVVESFEHKNNIVIDDTYGVAYFVASIFNKKRRNILLVASNLYNAEQIYNNIVPLLTSKNVYLFPAEELVRADSFISNKEFLGERIYTLNQILTNKDPKILIVHPSSLLRFLPSKENFNKVIINLKVNDKVDIKNLEIKLLSSGYYRVNKVSQSFEYSKRGDIFDIYSLNNNLPIRISLFDDEIESISFFDPVSQLSKEKVNSVSILPANDILFTEEEIKEGIIKIKNQYEEDSKFIDDKYKDDLKNSIIEILNRLESKDFSNDIYKYFSFIISNQYSLLDYFDPDLIFVANKDQLFESINLLEKDSREYLNDLSREGKCLTHLELFQGFNTAIKNKPFKFGKRYKEKLDDLVFDAKSISFLSMNDQSIISSIKNYKKENKTIIISLLNVSQKERIKTILNNARETFKEIDDLNYFEHEINITLFDFNEGVELVDENIVILTSKEIFNIKHPSLYSTVFKTSSVLNNFDELKKGDFVVHEYKGIGEFLEIKTIEIDGVHKDYIVILFDKGTKLYVPLNQFQLIRKYSGREGVIPKLTNISNDSWSKTKQKIKNKISDLTKRLKDLYKERASTPGFAFAKNDEFQDKFNSEFPFELTKDQNEAFNNISKDMEKPYPMDRLLCGDVGFGKTEVAFRAIFKCINSSKVAMLLCPTVLLCRQHYELAKIRFASFNINIAVFSRLIPLSQQKKYIKQIKEGKIHLIIGTHRLLSKDIVLNNLGLLVVDEEQRFGVEQKERIKEIVRNVDVLSLSATPIPRTLQMSLVGMRELSRINTPPLKRSPIQTYVTPYKIEIIKELIQRELSRKGQIYYVHNNTTSIYAKASQIQALIPNIKIAIVHGKMRKEDVEDAMVNFYLGNIDLLLATSIIENGLDVSNANMIIVENADLFGLSQLYQIKGRVGRSDKIAYAYLFYDENKKMNEEGRKRLKAIQEFTSLGSGYKIAEKDLMIRGAGDILGKEQAGFIDSVGLDLYIKILNECLTSDSDENILEDKPNLSIDVDAYLPSNFVSNGDKLEIYHEISKLKTLEDVDNEKNKLKDIYGRIPEEVMNLLLNRKIDIILLSEEFENFSIINDYVFITLKSIFTSINNMGIKIFDALLPFLDKVKITNNNFKIRIEFKKEKDWIGLLFNVINKIHNLYLMEKNNANR